MGPDGLTLLWYSPITLQGGTAIGRVPLRNSSLCALLGVTYAIPYQ